MNINKKFIIWRRKKMKSKRYISDECREETDDEQVEANE